jgi:hypothetical protein
MNTVSRLLVLLTSIAILLSSTACAPREQAVSETHKPALAVNDVREVEANPARGFNFPYFLFIPDTIDKNAAAYLLVEPNNTGTRTDDFDVHRQRALELAKWYPNRMARDLGVPLLVPVFPRPDTGWQAYTQALDRDTLEINEGELKRLDLQLDAMIDHAIELLRADGFKMHEQVFMHGFSASAKFCNRFAFLHPERVQAVACGGVNGLPTLPIRSRKGISLPFPIGIADIETFAGKDFDEKAVQRVAQYIYMGYFDRNDTLPSREAWSESEASIIREAIAAKMMPDRWDISRDIYEDKLPCTQCVTYNGVAHTIKEEMIADIVKFFEANSGDEFIAIEPHAYPFVEYRYIHEAHINGIYFKGDKALPKNVARHIPDKICLVSIEEWLPGQGHEQLIEFLENAGFRFRLRAEGHPEVKITTENYAGSSSKSGEFQAFKLRLNKALQSALVPGVAYTLHPENKSDEYFWTVNEGVRFVRPTYEDDIVPVKLNSMIVPNISLTDADVKDVVLDLNRTGITVDWGGAEKQIRFELKATPDHLARAPKISFSAKGLSMTEILLVICHRASLEYRIEGTTVYLEDRK